MLDDRSLNGVFLNGERVEWHDLSDGDELIIGRFKMYFVDTTAAGSALAWKERRSSQFAVRGS